MFRPNSANAFLRIGVQGETMSFRSAAFGYLTPQLNALLPAVAMRVVR
ncbi:hypothetical protein LEP1GSC163_0068 [Leptospira santarosai str. CBC379]|uniref:Uncharacterized protein n=1 Tax=Leptospira santarosai str. MOR084 TaxID=1049984 RepID=A0A0E2BCB1_9LEPT|nr:hypothetical protein LEP1GSC179_3886 [Leptospira santarosai str. MOR084]EKR89789.1 hypothetical protein LEP1GSC163_0068 [Leptospira santarosai str. CBC379]